jgi:hypothetical protein
MVVDDFEVGQLQDVWREDPVVVGTDNESWFGEILKELSEFFGLFSFCELAANFACSFFEERKGGLIREDGVQWDICMCEEVETVAGDSATADYNSFGEGVFICHD